MDQSLSIAALFVCVAACAPAHEHSVRDKPAALVRPKKPAVRTVHPQPGSSDCIQMYGSCTPPPNPLCTSNAFVLTCGESGELPSNGEPIVCMCP